MTGRINCYKSDCQKPIFYKVREARTKSERFIIISKAEILHQPKEKSIEFRLWKWVVNIKRIV